ncbi:DUF2752 domain-containing protein [Synechocystis sp. PCC 7339]|uniref:DUF2752 domain-containing protein n=1 Tax=unclassified Synechocystis TaxID=2640012 RepID=UPI001BAE914A|nr:MULTISPECIES: DUF2752 domain-containing protein [unclassified Synechocystis]QUS59715.1 DUF2752 domain-containing protein [Synechocystis sp. PCC 7338]UAJ71915.1 DUF2752 domain-containing protein [Synechocystis sp. PCC 7339]
MFSLKHHFPSPLLSPKAKEYLVFTLVTLTIVVAGTLLFLFDPASSKLFPPSPFRSLTGLYCPGCGTLRALHQLLHGNLVGAFGLNPLMIISLPFMVYSYVAYGLKTITGQTLLVWFIPPKVIWFILQAILAYWVARNIPLAPFSWLAP